jgi:outer membrane protein
MFHWLWLVVIWMMPIAASAQASGASADPVVPTESRPSSSLGLILDKARQIATTQGAVSAYRFLQSHEPALSGDVEFDFALGLAAVDAGEAARAIFAFERVITNQPGHLRARAELARAYAVTKEFDAAKKQLDEVSSQQLPPGVRDTVNRFLSAIDIQRQAAAQQADTWSASVDFSLGHDSNANLGSSNSTWIGAGGLTLYPSAQLLEQSSSYWSGALNLSHSRRINDRWSWSNGASIGGLWNLSDAGGTITRNFGTFDARSGIAYRADSQEWSLTMLAQHLRQDNDASRNAIGVNGQWQKELGKHRLAAFLQSFGFKHPGAATRNASRHLGGLSWISAYSENSVAVASLGVGKQKAAVLPQFGFSIAQLRLSAEHLLTNRTKLIASAGIEQRRYDGVDPLFGSQTRRDTEKDVKLGLQFALAKNWTLTPSVALTQNDSSVQAYEFKRRQLYLFARYRF